jgi:hypothetical protein
LENLLESCRAGVLSGKVSVEKQRIYDIIDDLRLITEDIGKNMPNEIKQARRIIADGDKILNDSRNKAQIVIKNAENEAAKMINEHEVIKQASVRAAQMDAESRKSARELRKNAIEYSDEILAKTEEAVRAASERFTTETRGVEDFLNDTADTLYENRKELRGIKD